MTERDEQINFRTREGQKEQFTRAMEAQGHLPSVTALFQSVMDEVIRASAKGRLIEWPLELVTKKPRD